MPQTFAGKCGSALKYGFYDMIQDLGKWLVIGLAVGAVITMFVPDDFFATFSDYPIISMLIGLGRWIPMYLCATG